MKLKELVIATRGSKLSLVQTQLVVQALKKIEPDIEIKVLTIKTKGDIEKHKPIYEIDGKGVFEKEVNRAVLAGKAHIAIHSLKDVPSNVHKDLILAAVLPRGSPYDALICREVPCTIYDLPYKSRIGTSSIRRMAMLRFLRPDLNIVPVRGNVDTRLNKLKNGIYDALVLAEAGILRLGIQVPYYRFNVNEMVPAPCQGIIGIFTLKSNTEIIGLLKLINDEKTWIEAQVERTLMKSIGTGCKIPFGVLSQVIKNEVRIIASFISLKKNIKISIDEWVPLDNWISKVEKLSSYIKSLVKFYTN